jgi:SAM-dependent methyltransferase
MMSNLPRSIAKRLRKIANRIDAAPELPLIQENTSPEVVTAPPQRFLHYPKLHVDVEASPPELQRLVDLTARTWTRLGQENAHWSVLSWPEFLSDHIDHELFFQTGASDYAVLSRFFERADSKLPDDAEVLELGCGVGRITRHLCSGFRHVTAVDISAPHLALAEKQLSDASIGNVSFQHLTEPRDIDDMPSVGLFYSVIVLQHNPPPVAYDILRRCLMKVEAGGYAYFQIPIFRKEYSFSVSTYAPDEEGRMEMHVIPQLKINQLLQSLDFSVLEIREDGATGDPEMVSNTFFARR